MSRLQTIVAYSVPMVAALFGLFWFFRRKDGKPTEPPDKKGGTQNEKPADKTTAIATSSSKTEINVTQQNSFNSSIARQRATERNAGESLLVSVPVKEPSASAIASKTKSDLLNKSEKVDAKNVKDLNNFEQPLVEEKIAVTESVQVETAPVLNASRTEALKRDDTELKKTEQKDILKNGSEETVQTSKSSSPAVLDQIIQRVEKNESVSSDSVKIEKSESVPKVQETSIQGLNDCQVNDTSLSRSWHEEVSEQCDNVGADSDNAFNMSNSSGLDGKKSPTHDLSKNGVNNEAEGAVSADTLNKSPLSSDSKKDDAQTSSDSSSNCDNLSEASNDSGKGGSVNENSQQSSSDEERVYEFNIPSDMCGLFIGSRGKTVKSIRDQSGARIRLRNNPYTPDFQICVVEGQQSAIDRALNIIKRKFPSIKYPGMDLTPLQPAAPVIMPEIMQLGLPEGVSVDIVVSSIVDVGRVFVQQPTHPSFPSLERLNAFMNQCYLQDGSVPDIPRPIESGVICAAPMLNGWYRAQIMAYYENSDECDIKYVDYGGYSHISTQCLKQIRSDFMTLPFEAVECYLGNITPLENESYFSPEAAAVLEELTQRKLLQAQVVGRAEDGIPYIHIYQINGSNSALLVNRELVNRGVVRWVELMT